MQMTIWKLDQIYNEVLVWTSKTSGFAAWLTLILPFLIFPLFHWLIRIWKNRNPSDGALKRSTPPDATPLSEYTYEVGARMRMVREQLLHISKREMTEFLELNSVNVLERYESGVEEYPLLLLKKIEEFFWIERNFVEHGILPVNQRFHLGRVRFINYIEDGYIPNIFCCPTHRSDLFCYIVMKRYQDDFVRVAVADLLCSFASNGGGRSNIGNLIDAMLTKGVDLYKVPVLTAKLSEWTELKNGCFFEYDRDYWGRTTDFECQKIFNSWYQKHKQSFDEFEGYKKESLAKIAKDYSEDKTES